MVASANLEDLGDGRTKLVNDVIFRTPEQRDSMIGCGMEQGLDESHAALDQLLTTLC